MNQSFVQPEVWHSNIVCARQQNWLWMCFVCVYIFSLGLILIPYSKQISDFLFPFVLFFIHLALSLSLFSISCSVFLFLPFRFSIFFHQTWCLVFASFEFCLLLFGQVGEVFNGSREMLCGVVAIGAIANAIAVVGGSSVFIVAKECCRSCEIMIVPLIEVGIVGYRAMFSTNASVHAVIELETFSTSRYLVQCFFLVFSWFCYFIGTRPMLSSILLLWFYLVVFFLLLHFAIATDKKATQFYSTAELPSLLYFFNFFFFSNSRN